MSSYDDQKRIASELFDEVKRLQAEVFELKKPLPWLRAEEIKENGWYRIATPARYFGEMYIEVDGDELFCCLGVDYDLSFLPDVIDDAARFRGPIATPELPVPELPKEESK